MTRIVDGKRQFADVEIVPHSLATVLPGNAGQLAPVSDQGLHRLYVRNAEGLLTPAAAVATTTAITMEVDHTLGTSPPAGTTITSQAEYDALVAGFTDPYLKYPQDAVDILPPVLAQSILVNLADGEHRGKPDSYAPALGMTAALVVSPKVWDIAAHGVMSDLYPDITYNGRIQFRGNMQTEEAAQGGVIAGAVLTRDAGTWTVDEHLGQFVEVISGASAGTRFVIIGNSTTEINVPRSFPADGACSFEIIEPAAKLHGEDAMFVVLGGGAGWLNEVWFDSVDVGTPAAKVGLILAGTGRLYLRNSRLHGDRLSMGSIVLEDSYGYASSALGGGSSVNGKLHLHQALWGVSVGKIFITESAKLINYLSKMVAQDGYAGVMFDIEGKASLDSSPVVDGGGSATAFLFKQASASVSHGGGTITVNNCATAIEVTKGAHIALSAVAGTGNTTAFKLSEGARISTTGDPTNLAATTEIDIDGDVYAYTDVPSAGDWIEGAGGSRFTR